jgi:hypothetical protein
MPLHFQLASKADIPALVALYFTTFQSPLVLRAKPDVPSTREWFRKSLERDMEKPSTRVYKIIEVDGEEEGEMIAFGKWSTPGAAKEEQKEMDWPVDGDAALIKQVVANSTEKKKKLMNGKQFWCMLIPLPSLFSNISLNLIPL